MKELHYQERLITPPPELAAMLTREVEEFAKKWVLQWEAWHHDEPIWYVWKEEREARVILTRMVQLAVFTAGENPPEVKAIAFAQLVDEKAGEARSLEKPRYVVPASATGLRSDPNYWPIRDLLTKAWEAAQGITRADFPRDKVTIPPRPSKWPP